ncbi:maleylpyruvate isomerase family mycothiol-dependent enzyme [Paractinoplanes ferrugineus]|uniref:Mycothiol-dependent maleylpyruvate isomerase metal-binding domain-containing protein n=1 Tax=Paractinoplanes ferrugineus TaxID=113564 RepID=A0A919J0X9_9ACTN|nr:maleylpyruvate isomerase family mycothiol-dependent enzyme [Actinoplanes ferrugineus]GIE11362.1 hypothetical protein Afe05nite_32020 [Actinoplanes ferrugineus]
MTTLADRTIAALRAEHDALPALSAEQLTGPSGAADWTVAQVYSHLGSGAEIMLAGLRAGTGEAAAPEPGFNESVWDRWNALSPQDQASGAIESDAALVAAFEALTPEQRDSVEITGIFPMPLSLEAFAALRLSEVTHHSWDIRVAADPAAGLPAATAEVLAEHLAGGLSFFLGFITKAEAIKEPAVVAISGTPYAVVLGEKNSFTADAGTPTATFEGPLEAALRLLVGRLGPGHTPATVGVTGNVTLDDLRAVFPGF